MTKLTFGKRLFTFVIAFILAEFQPLHGYSNEVEAGKAEYESKCAACHGLDGRGKGPAAPALRRQPPDLRLLTKKNGGVFPAEVLRNIIDGRRSLRVHGNYEMPVWGKEKSPDGSDNGTSGQITAIIEYLRSIQIR